MGLELCTLSNQYNILLDFLLPIMMNTVITVIYLIVFFIGFSGISTPVVLDCQSSGEKKGVPGLKV